MENLNQIQEAVKILKKSKFTSAFTGAGISVESGIPPFRGEDGIWSKYDPKLLDINYFLQYPEESWIVIKDIFYDFFGKAKFNAAHSALSKMEKNTLLNCVITQNIDNLHQEAGSKVVYEFHGNSKKMICMNCKTYYNVKDINLNILPPKCNKCGGLIKPDFIFFGEGIPTEAFDNSVNAANISDVFIVIGTTGEIMPASHIPILAKQNGAKIIEVNIKESNYTNSITDIFLQGKATEVMEKLANAVLF
ncbi:MAG: NAD-dependent deacylase [Bacteroidales bacterium]|nr:NAD-dependent deacylase [Bacteroidales bacterium]